ncbi:MAG: hypothetical protein F4X83_10655 [Chloroflexi bacterium]|nr:hypothetical protein [Chloroflexota bacterium]
MPVIGRIVKSNSHTDYVCQVFAPRETAHDPAPQDYAFGSFVQAPIDPTDERTAVGLVYDTILLNPEYGSLGPRLNPPSDQALLAPDYLVEKATAVGILIVGLQKEDAVEHGVIPLSLPVDAEVSSLDDDDIRRFHLVGGKLSLGYLPNLISHTSPLVTELGLSVIRQLLTLFEDTSDQRLLRTLAAHFSWQARVTPLG